MWNTTSYPDANGPGYTVSIGLFNPRLIEMLIKSLEKARNVLNFSL